MRAPLLIRFLVGDRRAILQMARSRWSMVIGALFVLSAGVAREYDGEDLVHEPWHALRPLGASFVSGTALFLLVHGVAMARRKRGVGDPPRFGTAYASFMGLFWMTAPLAWLYAVPYERFLSPIDAVIANLWTLAIVAGWRVALTTRIVSVVYGVGPIASFFLVMLFANAVTMAALAIAPAPVIDVMGGLRQTEREQLVSNVTLLATVVAWLSAPVWLLLAAVAAARLRPEWPEPEPDEAGASVPRALAWPLCMALTASIALLLVGQPEQVRRAQVERLFAESRFDAALAYLSEHERGDFPPNWEPPPNALQSLNLDKLDFIRESMRRQWPAPWVADVYVPKIRDGLLTRIYPYGDVSLVRAVGLLEGEQRRLPDPRQSAAMAAFLLRHDTTLTAIERAALERLIWIVSEPTPTPAGGTP